MLLLVVGLAYDAIFVTFEGQTHQLPIAKPIPFIAGRALGTLAIPSGEDPEPMQVTAVPSLSLAFADGELCADQAVTEVLAKLRSHVVSVVNDLAIFV
jgi:hypothetical protein